MANLTVTAVFQPLEGSLRYLILVDGDPVEEVVNGQSVQFDIEPGQHEVRVEISQEFARRKKSNSISFIVEPDVAYHFEVRPRLGTWFGVLPLIWYGSLALWPWPIRFSFTLHVAPLVLVFAFSARLGTRTLYLREATRAPELAGASRDPRTTAALRLPPPALKPLAQLSIGWVMWVIALLAILFGMDAWLRG